MEKKLCANSDWFRDYLRKQGLTLTPEAALEQLDAEQWRRMQAAWRAHRAKSRARAVQTLKKDSWHRLELIAQRIGASDLDAAIAKLDAVPDLGDLVRKALPGA